MFCRIEIMPESDDFSLVVKSPKMHFFFLAESIAFDVKLNSDFVSAVHNRNDIKTGNSEFSGFGKKF